MDVPPVAQRVSNNCANQGQLVYSYVSTLAMVMTPEELSCVLKPFVTSRSWLVYDESAKVSQNKAAQRERVEARCPLDGPPRVFTTSRVHTVCSVSGIEATGVQFGMSPDSSKEWGETTTNRLQNLCRTVSQSLRKNPRPEFAASFPWSPTATDTRGTLVTLWCTIENSVWLGVVCRTGQDQQRCRARSLCPRERNQPTHR